MGWGGPPLPPPPPTFSALQAVLCAVGIALMSYVALIPKTVMRALDGLEVLSRERFRAQRAPGQLRVSPGSTPKSARVETQWLRVGTRVGPPTPTACLTSDFPEKC